MFPYQLNRGKTLKNLEDVMRSRMTSEAEEGVVGKFRDWRSSNRFDKIKSEAWNKDFHMRRLQKSVARTRKDHGSWLSPFKKTKDELSSTNPLFTSTPKEKQNNTLTAVDLNSSAKYFGRFMTVDRPECFRPTKGRKKIGKNRLNKIVLEFQSLVRLSIRVISQIPLVVFTKKHRKNYQSDIISKKYASKLFDFESQDPVKITFVDFHVHFREHFCGHPLVINHFMRAVSPSSMDLQSLIKYHCLFITKEASQKQKLIFVCDMLIDPASDAISNQQYMELLEHILNKNPEHITKLSIPNPNIFRQDICCKLQHFPELPDLILSNLIH